MYKLHSIVFTSIVNYNEVHTNPSRLFFQVHLCTLVQ